MASGDTVGNIIQMMFPGANSATPDIRVSGSTPAANVPVFDFDAGTAEYLDLLIFLTGYGGGGVTLTLGWMASTATSGDVVWRAAFRALVDDAEDIDASHTYSYQSTTATTASASGEVQYTTITFTDGAQMDNAANGEFVILRIGRDAANGSDTMTGDAELLGFILKET